jgi:hypothetical protein
MKTIAANVVVGKRPAEDGSAQDDEKQDGFTARKRHGLSLTGDPPNNQIRLYFEAEKRS